MRQIFTSQRVENAEGVAKLLRDSGIEVHVTNGHSYHSKRRGQFSYLDAARTKNLPTVWVVRAEQQPQAREILRGLGLMESTRESFDVGNWQRTSPKDVSPTRWSRRIRIALLLVIAVAALLTGNKHRQSIPKNDEIRVPININ